MSDENSPKLRLRPKLAGGPAAVTPTPATPPAEVTPPEQSTPLPPPVVPEVRPASLRPKLALKAEEAGKGVESPGVPLPPPVFEPATEDSDDPRSFPPPPKPVVPTLAPRLRPPLAQADRPGSAENTGANPPFPTEKFPAVLKAPPPPGLVPPPSAQETWPAVLDAPPPPGLKPTLNPAAPEEEPAEITAIRKASTFPFPASTAKFPPLPGLASSGDTASQEPSEQDGFLKKLLLGGVLAIVLLGAVVFACFKFLIKPVAKPKTPPAAIAGKVLPAPNPTTETKIPKRVPAPAQETVPAQPAPVAAQPEPATVAATPSPAPEVVPPTTQEPGVAATPPPPVVKRAPPQPSLAFKAWVINLRIRGVRGGEAQRVFIDKTSYAPGDVVNPQLGIIFVGYDESARLLTFQDKTGAVFERRN